MIDVETIFDSDREEYEFMQQKKEQPMNETELKQCPFCKEKKLFIGVHDDEGNYHGHIGCEYEKAPWSGLCYALHHDGWGECILCTDGDEMNMGGVLFDTAEDAAEELEQEGNR